MPLTEYYGRDDSASTIAPSFHTAAPVTSLREYYAPGLPARTAAGFQGPSFDIGVNTEEHKTLIGPSTSVLAVAFSHNGTQIAAGTKESVVYIWPTRSDFRRTLIGHTDMVTTVAFSPDGSSVASGSADRTIRHWDAHRNHTRKVFTGHEASITAVAFSPEAAYIISASEDKTVCVWNTVSGSCRKVSGQKPPIAGAAFVRGGTLVALSSAGTKPTIKLFDLQDPGFRFLPDLEAVAHCVAFSQDGKIIAAGLADNTVQWWDTEKNESQVLTGHQAPVFAIACSPDGNFVASGSADGDVRIWNRAVTQNHLVINFYAKVWSVSFSPDGKYLVVGLGNGGVRLFGGVPKQTAPANRLLRGSLGKFFKSKP